MELPTELILLELSNQLVLPVLEYVCEIYISVSSYKNSGYL